MSQIGRELQITLQSAVREAVSRRHAYLTVEHLLFALAHSEDGERLLKGVGVDVLKLVKSLTRFFDEDLEPVGGEGEVQTQQTLAFHRVIEHAMHHAESAEKEEVEVGDILAALLQEPDCHAVELLRAQEVSRLDVLRFISHGVSKTASPAGPGAAPALGGEEDETPADPLAAFTADLCARARDGKLDPLVGRGAELERAIHILARRRKNNPIFVGETGVGKTALAEGLALRIVAGDVPEDLTGAEIYALDIGALLAGTRYRGDFEARFKALIEAVMQRERPILFIDEIHTILGAGAAQGGTVDASNLLKPILQAGELRCIGSTTYGEYRHFERDHALARRFQKIDVQEPSVKETIAILEGLAPRYAEHHQVRYTRPALRGAAELSARHLTDRFLPDKAIDVIDEVGAAVRLRPGSRKGRSVTLRDVEAQIARMARIPAERASTADRGKLEGLREALRAVVYGQDHAIDSVVRAVKRSRAGLGGRERPVGCFLFNGPTGVGKTELAVQLAACMNVAFLRFDMSEYVEKHAVARLIGAPPGYVGYDEGGQLVEKIRKQPHAVLLLDEIEKAHQDFFDILLQVMDHATLTDNHGREADFRNVTLIMTSNAGAREISKLSIGFQGGRRGDGKQAIERIFSPEFRNRLDEVVTFSSLAPEVMGRVVDKFIAQVQTQLAERRVEIELSPAARAWLARKGYDEQFGARPLARVVQTELEDRLADELLFGELQKGGRVRVDVDAEADRLAFAIAG